MFNLFKNKTPQCPIAGDMRLWMENAFLWLATQFGNENIFNKHMLLPTQDQFPFKYDGSQDSLHGSARIIAQQMEINVDEVELHIFKDNIRELNNDGIGQRMFTQLEEGEKMAAGLYYGRNENGKYDVMIEHQTMLNPEGLVATLAHEFAHIKLLGENRVDFNDELLTDLTTVVFGFGIFNSNAYFNYYQGYDGWRHNTTGYLNQQEWGYALALYAYFREEKDPDWIKYLCSNIRSDFQKSTDFIAANTDKIFMEEYKVEEPGNGTTPAE